MQNNTSIEQLEELKAAAFLAKWQEQLMKLRDKDQRIAELEEEYELDTYDIQEIRDEEYRLGGWSYDPFPEIEEEEEEEAVEE